MKTHSSPTEDPTEVTVPSKEPTEVAAPNKEPTEVLAPMEVSTKEPATQSAGISGPVGEPNVPPEQHEEKGREDALCSSFPGWTEVLHPAQLTTSAG